MHETVRCPKDAPRGARRLCEHRRGLSEIVELVTRGVIIFAEYRKPESRRVFGRFGALLCGAVVTHGCSVVNAGIAAGDGSGVRHASNYLGLVARYVTLVIANAWRTRGPLRIISLLCVVGAAWTASAAARTKHGDDCPLAK